MTTNTEHTAPPAKNAKVLTRGGVRHADRGEAGPRVLSRASTNGRLARTVPANEGERVQRNHLPAEAMETGMKCEKLRRWTKRTLLWSILTVVALCVLGILYQTVATAVDRGSESPSSGRMVNVVGHRLHINCVGKGSPTVVLESGWSFTSVEWSAYVQPEIARRTRVCAYDRAGLAYSEIGSTPRDAVHVAGELHALLHKASVKGPYVLVGHSLGGLYSRVYADRYPEEVAGMVLVQSMHPDQFERLGTQSSLKMNRLTGIIGPPLARLGVVRLLGMFPPSQDLPEPLRRRAGSLYYQTPHLVAELEEVGAMPEAMDQARETANLGGKPLTVVSASNYGAKALTDSRAAAARYDRESRALQEDLTHLSSDSTMRVVEGATDDSLVLSRNDAHQTSEEIVRVVKTVRTGGPLQR
jgi:pimeloyl-ACP methyl ester carboxylesterase